MFIILTLLRNVKILFLCVSIFLSIGITLNLCYKGSYETRASFNILSTENYDPFIIFSKKDASKNYFGGKEEVSRTLGILKSKNFINRIIQKENLIEKYGYELSESGKSKTFKEFGDRLRINLNKDEGLITVKFNDDDPAVSFNVLNTLLHELEKQLAEEISSKNIEILQSLEENYYSRAKQSDSLYQELKRLRLQSGIIDSKSQGEFISKLSISKPNDNQVRNYINGIDDIILLETKLESEIKLQAQEKDKIFNLKKSIQKSFKAILLAEKPYMAEERSKPSIYIASAISLFIGLTISIIIIFTKEYLSKVDLK